MQLGLRPSAAMSIGPAKTAMRSCSCSRSAAATRTAPPARSCSCTVRRWRHNRHLICRSRAGPIPRSWWFARRGFDCWCVDMEGYGRSTKDRDNNAPIAQGADDCLAAATYIQRLRGKRPLLVYGISSGALRAALFAQRHPQLVARLALDAMVWTGEGSPTLAERKKKLQ